MHKQPVSIIECPRDAIQGWHHLIATHEKVTYYKRLCQVGFDALDMGSFVSEKTVPQMADTADVLKALSDQDNQFLTIIANTRGAKTAIDHSKVSILGFPLSISKTFQERNTNKTIQQAFDTLKEIQALITQHNQRNHPQSTHQKTLVVYLSMAFGNPYKEKFHMDMLPDFCEQLQQIGIQTIAIADTVGTAKPNEVYDTTELLINAFPSLNIGLHLHAHPSAQVELVLGGLEAGARRFDSTINGIGGCPFAKNELIGNLSTQILIRTLKVAEYATNLNNKAFEESIAYADYLFKD